MVYEVYSPFPLLFSSHNRLLHLSILFAAVPFFYSYYNEHSSMTSYSIEQAMLFAFDKMVTKPSLSFSKVVVGFNCNVDVIVPGTRLIEELNATTEKAADRETVRNINELSEAFNYMFIRGAAAERYMADEESFGTVVATAEKLQRMQYHIGGNAALMAEKIASGFPNTEAYLVGPIGPRSNALLHPSIKRTNSTRIVKDEVHVIMEYKQGEILGEHVAPSSSRFITSHDLFSGSSIVIDMFFKAISQFHPDLIIISGVHLLEFQGKEARAEKVAIIRRNLLQVSQRVPIHLELGSMGDPQHVKMVLEKIIPNVDSIGLTEQELAVICHVGGGPYTEEWPVQAGALHAHKVVDMLHWLLIKYGRHQERKPTGKVPSRLQRIHFKCLTFHIVVSVGTDWSNLAAGLAAGARISGRQACGASHADPDMLDLRVSQQFVLDSKQQKMYHFNSHEPVASWMRDDMVFIFTPVLVCKYPRKTVGIDDAVSTSALLFSQFFRSEHVVY